MRVTPIKTPLVEKGQQLLGILLAALPRPLRERDIVCVTSKIVSVEQGRLVDLSTVAPSPRALDLLATIPTPRHPMHPGEAELILRESELAIPGDPVWLTIKDGIFIANAGIDLSNVPAGYAILWPDRPWEWGRAFCGQLKARFGLRELGVILTDSRCVPLRRGVIGVAMAYSGFEGVESQKGKPDLFGRPLQFTEKSVADDLASAAILVTGEANERMPFVLVEDAPAVFTDRPFGPADVLVDPCIDMFAGMYSDSFKRCIADSPAREAQP